MKKPLCIMLMLLGSLLSPLLVGTAHASLGMPTHDFTTLAPPFATAQTALWGHHPDWDEAALAVIRTRKVDFEKAYDLSTFCPGYKSASQPQQEGCLLRMVSALVKLESGFNPKTFYAEDKGLPSVGLMQLSRGECKNAPTEADLKIATKNLTCGINKLADRVKKGQCLSCKAGAGAYWSTFRAPYTYTTRSGKILHLGKAKEIAALTSDYRRFSPITSPTPSLTATASTHAPAVTTAQVIPQPEIESNNSNAERSSRTLNNELWDWDWNSGG